MKTTILPTFLAVLIAAVISGSAVFAGIRFQDLSAKIDRLDATRTQLEIVMPKGSLK